MFLKLQQMGDVIKSLNYLFLISATGGVSTMNQSAAFSFVPCGSCTAPCAPLLRPKKIVFDEMKWIFNVRYTLIGGHNLNSGQTFRPIWTNRRRLYRYYGIEFPQRNQLPTCYRLNRLIQHAAQYPLCNGWWRPYSTFSSADAAPRKVRLQTREVVVMALSFTFLGLPRRLVTT